MDYIYFINSFTMSYFIKTKLESTDSLRDFSCSCKKQEILHVYQFYFDPLAFLYQEYRDTSKQQEIEQRRQRENHSPGVTVGTVVSGSCVTHPPVFQLQLRNSARSLSLWQNLEVVQKSGLLTQLPQKEIIMQEVR